MKQVFILFTFLSWHLNAQYETINWSVAGSTLLNFTTTPAIVSNTFPLTGFQGAGSTVSDAAGNLKVVTRTGLVYNAQGQLVAPQNATVPAGLGEQSGLVVPMPGNPGVYYVFFVQGYGAIGGLSYSVFNPALASGAGSLTVMNNTVNAYNTNNGLCAIKHCNGQDVWVVCAQDTSVTLPSYKIYSYLLTASGINTVPVISSVNNLSDPGTHSIAYLRSSPDGRRLAIGSRKYGYPVTYSVVVSDFNRTTGTLNTTYLARIFNSISPDPSLIEFSADGSKLYTVEGSRNIVQFDFCAGSPTAVVASANTVVTLPAVSTYSFYRGIQRAINGYIYLGQWTPQGFTDSLAAIQQPNNAGSACNFSLNVQSLGTGTYTGILPHYPHYLMKPLITLIQPNQACSKVMFTGPSTVCAAMAGSLSSFHWNFGEPASPTNTSALYSPTHSYGNAGNYHVKLILDDGQCVADTLYKTITVLSNPTLNINVSPLSQTVCPGQSTTLTATGASGYTWMPGALGGSQVAVFPQSNTTYSVMGEDNVGCGNTSLASVSVYPVSNLTVSTNPKMVCAGQVVTLTASGALSYTWNTGAQSHSLSVTPANTVVYTITSINSYSCSAVSSYTLNVINCTGLSGLSENQNLFAIYPNPVTEILNVELTRVNEGTVLIEIVNSLGQIIYSTQNLSSPGEKSDSYRIDLRGQSSGIYFIKISIGKQYAIKKLAVE